MDVCTYDHFTAHLRKNAQLSANKLRGDRVAGFECGGYRCVARCPVKDR